MPDDFEIDPGNTYTLELAYPEIPAGPTLVAISLRAKLAKTGPRGLKNWQDGDERLSLSETEIKRSRNLAGGWSKKIANKLVTAKTEGRLSAPRGTFKDGLGWELKLELLEVAVKGGLGDITLAKARIRVFGDFARAIGLKGLSLKGELTIDWKIKLSRALLKALNGGVVELGRTYATRRAIEDALKKAGDPTKQRLLKRLSSQIKKLSGAVTATMRRVKAKVGTAVARVLASDTARLVLLRLLPGVNIVTTAIDIHQYGGWLIGHFAKAFRTRSVSRDLPDPRPLTDKERADRAREQDARARQVMQERFDTWLKDKIKNAKTPLHRDLYERVGFTPRDRFLSMPGPLDERVLVQAQRRVEENVERLYKERQKVLRTRMCMTGKGVDRKCLANPKKHHDAIARRHAKRLAREAKARAAALRERQKKLDAVRARGQKDKKEAVYFLVARAGKTEWSFDTYLELLRLQPERFRDLKVEIFMVRSQNGQLTRL